MKRLALLLAIVMLAALAGCENVEADSPEAGKGSVGTSEGATPDVSAPSGLDAIPTDGPGEAAAVAAVPAALEEAKQMRASAGFEWPDITDIEPILTAYILKVEMNGQVALFEVRADGLAHSLYAYQQAFDAGTLVWRPAEYSSSPSAAPQSDREKAAVAAVEEAMRDSFPESAFTTAVHGYRFVYWDGNVQVLVLEIGTDGSVISVGS